MLAASHALIGAAICKFVPNPWIGYPLALLSHFAADLTPHWDSRTRKTNRPKIYTIFISLSDSLIGFFFGWLIFKSQINNIYLLSMMFMAQLPDWLEAPYLIFNWNFSPFSTIKKLQSRLHRKLDLPWGLILQILIISLIILISKL